MIRTSYYGNRLIKEMYEKGEELVSISRSTPENFNIQNYSALNPSWALIKKYKADGNIDEYAAIYNIQLNNLDPHKVYKDLNNKTILCYEKTGAFCHRHLIAKWLKSHGYKVEEL